MASGVGTRIADLDTPALVVDIEAMERNIARISSCLRDAGKAWRPHTKGIKVPAIAHRMIRSGAIGITCAKVSEAEVMVAAGIDNILIANQVVGTTKLQRLAALRRSANVMVAVDSVQNVQQIGAVASEWGQTVGALVEVNVGLERCGVAPGEPALQLARAIQETNGVTFEGVMAWEGHTQTISGVAAKERAIAESVGALTMTAERCRSAGLPVRVVSCGGSGTYRITARQPGVTEIQAGGGVFGDVFYNDAGAEVEFALTVHATVTSRPAADRIVADSGKKSMSGDTALPRPLGLRGVKKVRLAAEHATIELEESNEQLRVGDRIVFLVGYEDTTVCLHDVLYGVRGGLVEAVWPILGRGKLQ